MSKHLPPLLCAAALSTLVVACGSNGPSTNLKSVMFRTMTGAPVATVTIQRQNSAAIANAQARFDARQLFDGWMKVGQSMTATANANGVAAIALPSGSYPLRIDPRVSQTTALVGKLNDTFAISADTNKTYQTSQQTWTVTSGVAFKSLHIQIYQVDADGKAMTGGVPVTLDPLVLDARPAVPGSNATTMTFSTELFKGSYRAVVTAAPVNSTDNIAPFETASFNAAGGGATEPQTATLASGGNVVSFHFMDGTVATPDAEIGQLSVYDAASLLPLGSAASVSGTATVSTGTVASVVALVVSKDGATMWAGAETASAAHSKTITRYNVSGHAKPPGTTSLTLVNGSSYGTLEAQFDTSSLGAFWTDFLESPVNANLSDALGTYTTKLFGGNWSLKATGLKGLPDSKPVTLSGLAADVPTEDVQIDAGAVLVGNIQDEARNNLANVPVSVYDSTHTFVGGASTDASGNYSIALPAGTYDVIAGGGLTKGVAVSGTTSTLNLTRFQVNGRLTDAASGPLAGRIIFGGGSVTATALGTYTLNAMQGINWFLFTPPSTAPAVGFAFDTNVLVNADTVKSTRQ